MSKREVIRGVLAANWILAGIAFSMWVYTVGNLFNSEYRRMVESELTVQEKEAADSDLLRERFAAKRQKYRWFQNMAMVPWLYMTAVCTGTAIGLMLGFPKAEPKQHSAQERNGRRKRIE